MDHCTEVRFSSFFSGGFITAIVVNPPERKLAKCTSVHCSRSHIYDSFFYREVNTRFEIRQKEEFQDRKEKSTRILVAIILVFVVCHIFRLSIQVRLSKKGMSAEFLKYYSWKKFQIATEFFFIIPVTKIPDFA